MVSGFAGRGNLPGASPAAHLNAGAQVRLGVLRRGFGDNFFQAVARRPARVGGFYGKGCITGGSMLHHGGDVAVCGSTLLHHREAAASTPQAVWRLERVNVAHGQSSGEAVSPASAVGGLRCA